MTTIADLKPDPKNPRKHDPRNAGMVRDSLQKFGAWRSIAIDENDIVYAGNQVLDAAAEAGIERVKIVEADGNEIVAVRRRGLSEEAKRRYSIADNRSNELSSWDTDVLADLDLDLGEFFFDSELKGLGIVEEKIKDPGPQIDRAAELQEKWQTARGQVWQIGKHRLMCGDSTSAEDVARLLDGAKPLLMVTDPPYGVEYDPKWRQQVRGEANTPTSVGDVSNDDVDDWSAAILLGDPDVVYLWHSGLHAANVQSGLERVGYQVCNQIIWAKNIFALSRGDYHWQHEPCWYAVKAKAYHHWIGDRKQTTLWDIKPLHSYTSDDEHTGHGTQKPLECMERPIRNHEGDVYDPFLGSGTTMVAAEQTGRICYGMEIEPNYAAVCLERMSGMGLEPVLTEL